MIRQFRKLSPVNLFFLIVIAIVLRIGLMFQLPETLEFNFAEPSLRLLLPVLSESPFLPGGNILAALVLVIAQAMLLNRIINQHNLLGRSSFLPALMYITVSAMLMPFMILSPVLLCNFLLIWMIGKFLNIHRRTEVHSLMFDMGMIVGVGTLIYFPFISMFILLMASLLIFRPFNWREWAAGFIGFALVYFFLAVFYFWEDALSQFYKIWLPLANPFPSKIRINLSDYIVLAPFVLILALSAYAVRQYFFRSYVQVRKSFQLLFVLFILAIMSFSLKPSGIRVYHFLLAAPAASVFMAYYFLQAKKTWVFESLYALLLAFIVYFQFF